MVNYLTGVIPDSAVRTASPAPAAVAQAAPSKLVPQTTLAPVKPPVPQVNRYNPATPTIMALDLLGANSPYRYNY